MPRIYIAKGVIQMNRTGLERAFNYRVETGFSVREAAEKYGVEVMTLQVSGEESPAEAGETEYAWVDFDAKKDEQKFTPKRKRGRPRKSEKHKQKISESKAHPSEEQNNYAEVYVDVAEDPEACLKGRWSSGDSVMSSRVHGEIKTLKEDDDNYFIAQEWDLFDLDCVKNELDHPENVNANDEVKHKGEDEEIVQVKEEK